MSDIDRVRELLQVSKEELTRLPAKLIEAAISELGIPLAQQARILLEMNKTSGVSKHEGNLSSCDWKTSFFEMLKLKLFKNLPSFSVNIVFVEKGVRW